MTKTEGTTVLIIIVQTFTCDGIYSLFRILSFSWKKTFQLFFSSVEIEYTHPVPSVSLLLFIILRIGLRFIS